MNVLILILGILLRDGAFLTPATPRDSVLVADRLYYGVELKEWPDTARLQFPEISPDMGGGILALPRWQVDTLKIRRIKGTNERLLDIRAQIAIQPFEEGSFVLPALKLLRPYADSTLDTLVFRPCSLEVTAMPIDTATFVPHDLKGQAGAPLTFSEVLPWALGALFGGLLVAILVSWLLSRRRQEEVAAVKDPAHVVALRKLDKFRGSEYWAPTRQKAFYSGVTDALREYIAARYGVGALEMTTAEIFDGLKGTDLTPELYNELKELFERADFIKFAKHTATDEENATVLPLAVRFVTTTYQAEVEQENQGG